MEQFNIPYYIVEELIEYIELTQSGKCKSMKWENIKCLLNCARLNNKLTQEQVDIIIEKYNREDI